MNFTRPVFLVRANLVFVGIRYKHLECKATKPFYTGCALRSRHGALALISNSRMPLFLMSSLTLMIATSIALPDSCGYRPPDSISGVALLCTIAN